MPNNDLADRKCLVNVQRAVAICREDLRRKSERLMLMNAHAACRRAYRELRHARLTISVA